MSDTPTEKSGRPVARLALGLAVIIAAGLVCFQVFRPRSPKPAPLREVLREELVLREGRLYRTNESEPFTGDLVERYPGGVVKSRSALVAGLLEGVSEGWYTNGHIQVREYFKTGVSDGLRRKWYEDGKLLSEGMIRGGEHHGTFRRWHENGQLAETVEMNRGHPDGTSLAYYPSGFLKARAQLKNGQVLDQKFWNDGELQQAPVLTGTNPP